MRSGSSRLNPRLYSCVLAFIGLSGIDAIRAARLLNIVLIGLDLLLFAGLIYYETRNKLLTILAELLFLFSMPMFMRYTWALTEPLFMTFLLGCFILYYRFLRTHGAVWVVALGFGTAILYLTRYAGIYLAAVWLPAILLVSLPKNKAETCASLSGRFAAIDRFSFCMELPVRPELSTIARSTCPAWKMLREN